MISFSNNNNATPQSTNVVAPSFHTEDPSSHTASLNPSSAIICNKDNTNNCMCILCSTSYNLSSNSMNNGPTRHNIATSSGITADNNTFTHSTITNIIKHTCHDNTPEALDRVSHPYIFTNQEGGNTIPGSPIPFSHTTAPTTLLDLPSHPPRPSADTNDNTSTPTTISLTTPTEYISSPTNNNLLSTNHTNNLQPQTQFSLLPTSRIKISFDVYLLMSLIFFFPTSSLSPSQQIFQLSRRKSPNYSLLNFNSLRIFKAKHLQNTFYNQQINFQITFLTNITNNFTTPNSITKTSTNKYSTNDTTLPTTNKCSLLFAW